MFDTSKIKTFDLKELKGRTLKIVEFTDKSEGLQMTTAFDIKTGDQFALDIKRLPQAK